MSVTFSTWKSQPLDRKTMDKTIRELDVLSKYSGDPHFQRSHPYLPDIAQGMVDLLRQIIKKNLWSELSHNQYLRVTMQSLLFKTAQCSVFLKGGGGAFSCRGSASRRDLTKMSLIFSHLLCELNALFPRGQFQGNSYKIVKSEAAKFWTQHFGTRSLVLWSEFKTGLNTVHAIGEGPLESALRSTIDLTCNEHISVFEFDIFTRLFQPWDTLLQNWMLLAVTHPGYMAFQTYDEVRDHLQATINKPGSYMFRLSCTHLGQWAIGYVTSSGTILQTIPHNKSLFQALQEGEKERLYLYPNGLPANPDLTQLSNSTTNTVIQVTEEQWELYSDMDSTFELCKICADNEKNVRIQPCGHLLCDQCLSAWQKSDGLTCPFCRCEIKGKEEIHITLMKDPVEITSSYDSCSENSGNFIDPEEEVWIKNRPLPPPPPHANPSTTLNTQPSAPPPPSPRTVSISKPAPPLPPHPTRPPLPPRRMALYASDIINANQQTQRLSNRISVTNRTQRVQSQDARQTIM